MSFRTSSALAAAGLLYPVLTVAAFAVFPEPPGGDVSAAHDPAWLAAHTGSAIAQSYVRAVAAIGFIALSVAVARRLGGGRGLSQLAVAGGAACGCFLLASQAAVLAACLASRAHLDAATVRPFDVLNEALLSLSSLPAVLLFAAAAVGLHQAADAPRWLVVLTAVGAPLALLDALSYDDGPLAALGLIGLAYFLVWSLATAATLLRHSTGTGAGHVPTLT